MSLPAFNPDATCQKCNADRATTRYCSLAAVIKPGEPLLCVLSATILAFDAPTMAFGEHHHRTCTTCGFQWIEDVYREPAPARRSRRRTTATDEES